MIIECTLKSTTKGLTIKAKSKTDNRFLSIAYNARQSLIENAKYCLVQLCIMLGIKGKSFIWCIVGDSVLFISVLDRQSNVFIV
jgi:hypothetical protein